MINIFLDKYSSFINLSSSTPLYLHFLLLIHIKCIAFSITFITKYKAFTFTKHPKSTILENRQLNDSFCILICGTIRHYTIDSNTAEEQTLRFTLSGNLLCQYGTATEATEYLSCLSECTILSVSNTILAEIGEETNLRIYCQNIIKEKIGRMCCGVRLTDGNSNGMPERQYASSSRKWIILLLIRQKTIISI